MNDNNLKAKPVVKNKFWIVEQDGRKIASLLSTDDGGIMWVDSTHREKFPTIKLLKDKHNLEFLRFSKSKELNDREVYGYPVSSKHFNELYDVNKKLPIYTKQERSKSFYCAGYYLIKLGSGWTKQYCPKLITLQRYSFLGPWKTEEEQQEHLRKTHGH